MPNTVKTACIQMTSGPDIAANLVSAEALIREAHGQGAQVIATPEMTDSIRRYTKDKIAQASDKPAQLFSTLAAELGVFLLLGSAGVRLEDDDTRLANRSMLFAPDGTLRAYYDKIHMFDARLSREEFYKESSTYQPGKRAVIVNCDTFTLGMGVCYDLRFAHLWRDMAKAGAQILSAPAAFAVPTGEAHWDVLIRARAIETGCFMIAPAQVGEHEGNRKTYGHAMIVNPWGEIIAQAPAGDAPCVITADLDLTEVEDARKRLPTLTHDREYILDKS